MERNPLPMPPQRPFSIIAAKLLLLILQCGIISLTGYMRFGLSLPGKHPRQTQKSLKSSLLLARL